MGRIQDALVTGVAVGGRHRALDDAECLIQHLHHRSHAIGGAAGVAENVPIFVAVLIGVNAHHKSANLRALARCRENYLFGTSFKVLAGTHIIVEYSGGFDHQIYAPFLPGKVGGIAVVEGFDRLAVEDDRVLGGGDVHAPQGAEHGVVLEQVGHGVGVTGAIDAH